MTCGICGKTIDGRLKKSELLPEHVELTCDGKGNGCVDTFNVMEGEPLRLVIVPDCFECGGCGTDDPLDHSKECPWTVDDELATT